MAKKNRHPLVSTLLIMLIVTVGIVIIALLVLKLYTRQGKEYELPQLVGSHIDSCGDTEAAIHFVIIDSLYNEDQPGGFILTQEPKAGTRIKKGRKVYVSVTAYTPGDVLMPDLCNGPGLSSAISQLYSMGLQGGKLKFVEGDANLILSQSVGGKVIEKDTPVKAGTPIDLTVGMGAGAKRAVPQVLGRTPREARRTLLMECFNVGKEHYKGVKTRSTAIVYKTDPPYDGISHYPQGTEVDIWYKDSEGVDVRQMLRDYKIDSSRIIYDTATTTEEDFIEDSFWQF
ncbi:MAG: PASTA domain-containing protein [Bacteroidales bacterium]|nr:PASTA domain-containing protein [Bacteroidales bacterium]